MNRQEEFWLEEGEEMGEGRAEGLSATGDRGQAAILFTPDVASPGSYSLLVSILSAILESDPGMSASSAVSFPLITDGMVALNYTLNSFCSLHVPFSIQVLCLNK